LLIWHFLKGNDAVRTFRNILTKMKESKVLKDTDVNHPLFSSKADEALLYL
jgi:hypothetical protein